MTRESYGLSWRTEGSGGHVADSEMSHLYFGVYSFDVGGLSITNNNVHDSVLYGIDPHTGSHNLKIQNNVVHDNGKHGIILAEDCVDSDISGNIVYRNQHHGIVLYQHSDRNTIVQQRDVPERLAGHQHQRVRQQRHPGQQDLRQRRVRHRHRADRAGQRAARATTSAATSRTACGS